MYLVIGAILLVKPEVMWDFLNKYMKLYGFQLISAVVGVLVGVIVFVSAGSTKFPGLFEVFGLLAGAGGVICIVIPRSDFQTLIAWEIRVLPPYSRAIGLVEGAFGVFLLYAIV